jgi:hypothetical protein
VSAHASVSISTSYCARIFQQAMVDHEWQTAPTAIE